MKLFTALSITLLSATSIAQNDIYTEDFQNGLPVDFTIVNNDGLTPNSGVSEFLDAWIILDDPDNPGDSIMGSTSYFEPAGTADRWLITPAITLGATGNYLYWEGKSHDASYPDSYHVLISTTDTQLSSFTDTLYSVSQEQDLWTEHMAGLSEKGFNSVTVYIAFVNRTNDGFKLYIDDLRVEENNPLGIDNVEINTIELYPNPASDVINFNAVVTEANVYSVDGSLVLTALKSNKVDVSELESGSYIVKIITDKGITTKKFNKL